MIDYIVLGMVQDEALTGYDVKKGIEAGIGNFYKVSYGNLYPALKRLTDKALVTMTETPQCGRKKKYCQATPLGKNTFMEWLALPFDFTLGAGALLAKIYFFGKLSEDMRNQQLQAYELYYRQSLQKLRAMEKTLDTEDSDYFMQSTLYFGIRNIQTAIEWFKHIKEQKPLGEFVEESL